MTERAAGITRSLLVELLGDAGGNFAVRLWTGETWTPDGAGEPDAAGRSGLPLTRTDCYR